MTLKDRIEEVMEHFDHCIVSKTRVAGEQVINVDKLYKPAQIYRRLILWYGVERVSKVPSGYKIEGDKNV